VSAADVPSDLECIVTGRVVPRFAAVCLSTYQLSLRSVDRETGIEPATFSLAST
jgi:hypothetical protein